MRAFRRRSRAAQPGMTLMEMMIVLIVVALVMTGMALGLGAVTRQRLKSSAIQVASAVRTAYSRSATTGKNVRLVFDLDTQTFWAEEAEPGRVLLSRDDSLEEEEEEEDLTNPAAGGTGALASADMLSGLLGADPTQLLGAAKGMAQNDMEGKGIDFDLMGQLGAMGNQLAADIPTPRYKRPRFGSYPGKLGQPTKLGKGVAFQSVYTSHREHPAEEGKAYLYFFTGGMTELAVIQLIDTDGFVNSVEVHPLTGRSTIHNVPYEPPYREEDRNEAAEML